MYTMTCKGICIRHKAQKPVSSGRYATGQKRCQVCEIFIRWDEMWCPCCGYRVRTRPRSSKFKQRLRAIKKQNNKEFQIAKEQKNVIVATNFSS
jgi:hypothetical protein